MKTSTHHVCLNFTGNFLLTKGIKWLKMIQNNFYVRHFKKIGGSFEWVFRFFFTEQRVQIAAVATDLSRTTGRGPIRSTM